MKPKYHFTINGDDKEGWSLNVYKYQQDKYFPHLETISTTWGKP